MKVAKVGVIVGRFQVAQLHLGHHDLFNYAFGKCEQLLVVLGCSRSFATERNPLSGALRAALIERAFSNVRVVELCDHPSDEVWSEQLDELIGRLYPEAEITLFGSRDSFLDVYSGGYPVDYFEPRCTCSGTETRKELSRHLKSSSEFLAGVIYREETRAPIAYPTVDIAILREGKVLLASKSDFTDKLFFIGGFVDEADSSLERAAKREIIEETGMEIGDLRYVGSHKVDDWRYRGTKDGVITSFFRATYVFGAAIARDDISSLEWVPIEEMMNRLAPEHQPLAEMLLASL